MVMNLGSLAQALKEDAPPQDNTLELRIERERDNIVKALKEQGKYTLQIGEEKILIVPNGQK